MAPNRPLGVRAATTAEGTRGRDRREAGAVYTSMRKVDHVRRCSRSKSRTSHACAEIGTGSELAKGVLPAIGWPRWWQPSLPNERTDLAHFINNLARPARGEIWWLPTKVGSRDGKAILEPKPWLVVHGNQWATDVRWAEILVVRITSDTTKYRPTQVPLGPGESFGGVALCETLTTASRWRLSAMDRLSPPLP